MAFKIAFISGLIITSIVWLITLIYVLTWGKKIKWKKR